jgi:hypothetical protein
MLGLHVFCLFFASPCRLLKVSRKHTHDALTHVSGGHVRMLSHDDDYLCKRSGRGEEKEEEEAQVEREKENMGCGTTIRYAETTSRWVSECLQSFKETAWEVVLFIFHASSLGTFVNSGQDLIVRHQDKEDRGMSELTVTIEDWVVDRLHTGFILATQQGQKSQYHTESEGGRKFMRHDIVKRTQFVLRMCYCHASMRDRSS